MGYAAHLPVDKDFYIASLDIQSFFKNSKIYVDI